MEKSLEAIDKIGTEVSVELIDLRSITPWDGKAIEESVRKTGRLVVVQEDTENCSVGQMIISHVTGHADIWETMVSPPTLISKGNVMIGYNPIYEYAALPDVDRIVAAVKRSASTKRERATAQAAVPDRKGPEVAREHKHPASEVAAKTETPKGRAQSITVPIMGEGIRAAKIVALLKIPAIASIGRSALRSGDGQGGLSDRILFRWSDGWMESEGRRHGRDWPDLGTILAGDESSTDPRKLRRRPPIKKLWRRRSRPGTARRNRVELPHGGHATPSARTRAFTDHYKKTQPGRSGESADRCPLGGRAQGA
jgi:hypothetical protein